MDRKGNSSVKEHEDLSYKHEDLTSDSQNPRETFRCGHPALERKTQGDPWSSLASWLNLT